MKTIKLFLLFGVMLSIMSCNDDALQSTSETSQETNVRQNQVFNYDFFDPCKAYDITYYIDDNCGGTVYENAIQDAVQVYNDAFIGVALNEIENENDADIVISCVSDPVTTFGDRCGEARTFFDGGVPSAANANINLSLAWETCPCTDLEEIGCHYVGGIPPCVFTRTVMREIGQALGVDYNNANGGPGNAVYIAGTNDSPYVPNSIFNSPAIDFEFCSWCVSPCEFSGSDLLALQTLYPPCQCPSLFGTDCECAAAIDISIPTIWEEKDCVDADANITLCAYGWAGDVLPNGTSFQWSLNGSLQSYDPLDQRCIHINVGADGGFASIFVETDCGPYSISREINICEEEPTTGGGGTIPPKGGGLHIE